VEGDAGGEGGKDSWRKGSGKAGEGEAIMESIQEIDYFDYLYIQSTDNMSKKIIDNLIKEGRIAIRKRHTKSKVAAKRERVKR